MKSPHAGALVVLVSIAAAASLPGEGPFERQIGTPSRNGWALKWSDEFEAPDGSSPDESKWVAESGGGGWGNHELQLYTSRPRNVRQESGNLVIEAYKEDFTGAGAVQRNYTSARLTTAGKFTQRFGRVEARIKLPSGKGVWPAFWMLGDNLSTVGWPACGEIDIMESIGSDPTTIRGSLHGPGYSGAHSLTAAYKFPTKKFPDEFHVFAVEWAPAEIRFYVDDVLYATRTPENVPAGGRWVFDHPFFVILNLAVGGNMPGNPDDSTVFPQRMLVDYVRVYSPIERSQ